MKKICLLKYKIIDGIVYTTAYRYTWLLIGVAIVSFFLGGVILYRYF